jgi:endonuclease YncB( thermonuclease family)
MGLAKKLIQQRKSFNYMKKLVFIILLFFSLLSFAEELIGKVIKVSDGDTISVLDSNNQKHKVRLKGIDAPESQQMYGDISTQSLSELVYDKEVLITWDKKDKYYRILGKVIVDGRDVNYEQLKKGLAWYYKQYEKDLSDEDKKKYSEAEEWSRNYTEGLWADSNSIPPWEFRHKGKN